jgi:DHA2 family multidrug resistance protein-like MFS transporter
MVFQLSLPFCLEHSFGFTPSQVGLILAAWPLSMITVSPIAGTLADRAPEGLLGSLGMGISVIGLLCLADLPAHPSAIDILWRMALGGIGFGLFSAPNVRQMIRQSPSDRAASAGAMVSTTRLTGQTFGAIAFATILPYSLHHQSTPAMVAASCMAVAMLSSASHLIGGQTQMRIENCVKRFWHKIHVKTKI